MGLLAPTRLTHNWTGKLRVITLNEEVRKTIDITKKKDTGCEFKNSDLPSTTCILTEQQLKSYRGIADSEFLKHTRSTQTRKRICPYRF